MFELFAAKVASVKARDTEPHDERRRGTSDRVERVNLKVGSYKSQSGSLKGHVAEGDRKAPMVVLGLRMKMKRCEDVRRQRSIEKRVRRRGGCISVHTVKTEYIEREVSKVASQARSHKFKLFQPPSEFELRNG